MAADLAALVVNFALGFVAGGLAAVVVTFALGFVAGAVYGVRATNGDWSRRMTALHRLGAMRDYPDVSADTDEARHAPGCGVRVRRQQGPDPDPPVRADAPAAAARLGSLSRLWRR